MQLASKKKSTQHLLQETASMKDNKSSDFLKSFVKPYFLQTYRSQQLKSFLELHFARPIPDESALWKNYLSQCNDDTISKIRGQVHGKEIFVSIDETTDVKHRYVTKVVIGTLEIDGPGEVFLLISEVITPQFVDCWKSVWACYGLRV